MNSQTYSPTMSDQELNMRALRVFAKQTFLRCASACNRDTDQTEALVFAPDAIRALELSNAISETLPYVRSKQVAAKRAYDE